jgi:phosphoribosylformimino-5-aminoimidazole carboxamide ribotide isomerase
VQLLLDGGVQRVIIGTRAWADPESLGRLVAKFGDRIAVGIDAREGMVQIKGWTETTTTTAVDLARRAADLGVKTLIVTDTAMDGMLHGVNVHAIESVCNAVSCEVIASGGVSSVHDVLGLRGLRKENLVGAIVGKALYEGRTTVRELQNAAR